MGIVLGRGCRGSGGGGKRERTNEKSMMGMAVGTGDWGLGIGDCGLGNESIGQFCDSIFEQMGIHHSIFAHLQAE